LILSQILNEIDPPMKIVQKFLKTWRDRDKSLLQYSQTSQPSATNEGQDAAGIALSVSRRLVGIMKLKKILNIEAGLEMIALALTISSEVCELDS
jgi:hypothetical protein